MRQIHDNGELSTGLSPELGDSRFASIIFSWGTAMVAARMRSQVLFDVGASTDCLSLASYAHPITDKVTVACNSAPAIRLRRFIEPACLWTLRNSHLEGIPFARSSYSTWEIACIHDTLRNSFGRRCAT